MVKEKNSLMVFEGNQVEVFEFEGKVLFNPKDVARCLDISDKTISNHMSEMDSDEVVKLTESISPLKGIRKLHNTGENFLTEEGVYVLIFKSRKPSAIKFQKWVTKEVLPSIRKHGAYMTDSAIEKALTEPDFLIQLATKLKEEKKARIEAENKTKELSIKIEEDKPKVKFADAIHFSKSSISMAKYASILNIKGLGRNKLYEWLRNNGYLKQDNDPYRKYIDLGIFEVIEGINMASIPYNQVLITGKGQRYLYEKITAGEVA